jgi:hypothetical protein
MTRTGRRRIAPARSFDVEQAFLLRDSDGRVQVEQDRHREGCFARADWLAWFDQAGFDTRIHRDPWKREVFVGIRRSG